jgi:secondary thiamine-phosphate synthase enzyme
MIRKTYQTKYKSEMIDITADVKEAVVRSGCKKGAVNVFVPHSSCAVFVTENQDPNVVRDILGKLSQLVPAGDSYAHEGCEAHIKASMLGSNVTIPVDQATLLLGPWQGIFLGEFDGSKPRDVIITVLN